ncbi:uncharacterized protein LOC125238707 [Leguminivora glycinivorella]|uniref:uncharacterized protein LOC125238707 n=1 Tax=Leguminivora glycinivorella TaxID=1035111 RepID=UPI00200CC0FC|nr:uncharacterized protein LOC125238707 [Leguminivora glycinivorella]
MREAFDLVSYDVLWNKLREQKVPAELLRIFQYWYLNQSNSVRWAGRFSQTYRLECGVRQGGITSPKLFSLYVNDLIEGLSRTPVGCRVDDVSVNNISYADDMVLLTPSVRAMRKLLGICEEYVGKHGLLYNAKKSEYMVFKAVGGKLPESVPVIKLNNNELKRVHAFKYLGHYVTDDLKDQLDIERERRALAVRCNMLVRRFARCSQQVKITLFKAYCQVFYTCSLWTSYSQKTISALRVLYNNGFRMLLGLSRFCSASGMFAQARTDDYYAIIRKRTASLLCRVRASTNPILATIACRYDSPIARHFEGVMTATRGYERGRGFSDTERDSTAARGAARSRATRHAATACATQQDPVTPARQAAFKATFAVSKRAITDTQKAFTDAFEALSGAKRSLTAVS